MGLMKRRYHVCWTRSEGALLLGGPGQGLASLRSSELIQPDGSSSSPSFGLENKNGLDNACGIELEDTYLVTGGYDSSVQYSARKSVSLYSTTGFQHDLPSLNTGRYGHACGKFYDDDGSQVYVVAGGWNDHKLQLASTEIYKDGSWTEYDNSLPTPRTFLRAATVGNIVYAFGGAPSGSVTYDDIVRFDRDTNTWRNTGKMTVPRERHAIQV